MKVPDLKNDPMLCVHALDPAVQNDLMRFLCTSMKPAAGPKRSEAEILAESIALLKSRLTRQSRT